MPRGTALVPTVASYLSRNPTDGDARDAGDAQGVIGPGFESTGGRKVAGSNPVAPIHPAAEAGADKSRHPPAFVARAEALECLRAPGAAPPGHGVSDGFSLGSGSNLVAGELSAEPRLVAGIVLR
jgi:hypothetical protein